MMLGLSAAEMVTEAEYINNVVSSFFIRVCSSNFKVLLFDTHSSLGYDRFPSLHIAIAVADFDGVPWLRKNLIK